MDFTLENAAKVVTLLDMCTDIQQKESTILVDSSFIECQDKGYTPNP